MVVGFDRSDATGLDLGGGRVTESWRGSTQGAGLSSHLRQRPLERDELGREPAAGRLAEVSAGRRRWACEEKQ